MEYRTLKDIAKITMGQSPDSSSYNKEKDGLPFFQGNADFGELYPNERIWCNEPKKVAIPGDILISVRAPIGALNYAKEKSCIGRGLAAITIKNVVERNYIFHLLRARNKYLNSKGTGSTFKAIGKNVLEEVLVPQISREEQQKCVNVIDLIESIIIERKSQIDKLDELVRARFVEMFGDPEINPYGYSKAHMGDYITLLTDFSSNGSYKTLDSGVTMYDKPNYAWMVRTTDLETGDMTSIKYIDESAYELLEKSKLFGGEIIMNKIGSAGNVYLMPEINMPASLGRNAFMFRYNDRINTKYLFQLLKSEYGQREIKQYVRGAVTQTITKNDVRAVIIVVPPIELQNKYVDFIEQVNKSKVEVQKALDKAQLLFDSLMQKYFG